MLLTLSGNGQLQTNGRALSATHKQFVVKPYVLKPDSYLFSEVDKSIRDTVMKRIKMDLHPDTAYYRKKALLAQPNLAPINTSSLKFVPVVERSSDAQGNRSLSICKEVACLYGKTPNGEDLYILATYHDYSNVTPSPELYQAMLKYTSKEKIDEGDRIMRSQRGADCWMISTGIKGDIMYQLMDYARTHSDNGKFFVLDEAQHYSAVCFLNMVRPSPALKLLSMTRFGLETFPVLCNKNAVDPYWGSANILYGLQLDINNEIKLIKHVANRQKRTKKHVLYMRLKKLAQNG
jgi:hypothetical protein